MRSWEGGWVGYVLYFAQLPKSFMMDKEQSQEHTKFFLGDGMVRSFHRMIYKESDGRYNDYNFLTVMISK